MYIFFIFLDEVVLVIVDVLVATDGNAYNCDAVMCCFILAILCEDILYVVLDVDW